VRRFHVSVEFVELLFFFFVVIVVDCYD